MQWSDLDLYDYRLPPELIAQAPHSPRDKARLLIYCRKSQEIKEDVYLNLPHYLPEKTVLVFNNSKVIPARIMSRRLTGGKCEILFIKELSRYSYQVMLSRKINRDEKLILEGGLEAKVREQREQFYNLEIAKDFPALIKYLEQYGTMPVPPYIKHPDENQKLKTEYQTIFAKKYGSVAAPTASLHFTKRLLNKFTRAGIKQEYVTLHVGLGTFSPLRADNLELKKLHAERYEVEPTVWQRLVNYQRQGYTIIPVGTTPLRTLETIAKGLTFKRSDLSGETRLFIQPGDKFKMAGGLITNFHLPKTSLLLLISAFIGSREETLRIYDFAIKQRYQFFSFGDGMLIL